MIRVLVTDDKALVRQGYCILLGRESDLQVVGEARDGQEAVDLAIQLLPDVVTMDIRMPKMDGVRATQKIRTQPNSPRVVMVASSWDDGRVKRSLEAGAGGYVSKTDAFAELPAAIRAVYQGRRYFSHQVASGRALDGLGASNDK